jgi:CRISPR-associated protein Cas5t
MTIALKVEVPFACFRQSRAREYIRTYPVPPPSTVYGMLLSLVGEVDRYRHCGVEIAIALLSQPELSVVLRTFHRVKTLPREDEKNQRPDYQEILSNIELMVWVRQGKEETVPCLRDRVFAAILRPHEINRFGSLCLGESRDLVDAVSIVSEGETEVPCRWLVRDEEGWLTLPHWVDHVGSKGTCWQRYELQEWCVRQPPEAAWVAIEPI